MFYSRSPQKIKDLISRIISGAEKFSVDKGKSYVNESWIEKKIATYKNVCDISVTSSPTKEPVLSPMSPKRPASEPASGDFGRGKRVKTENRFFPGALDFNFAVPSKPDDYDDEDYIVDVPKQQEKKSNRSNMAYSETIRQCRRFHLPNNQIAIIINAVNK